ncbi:DUF3105 domain-containing protein [Actinotalea fermentans]|uniref:DUF3105 domain-containing protein n=1 Tax=Actinotalea fermentans TaxID=43671 RepID=A0A511Z1Q3_9CELL|nr:DUF3105 domain-containing protein [Actinotalea fermentans]KGM16478.1 hypothetical protein N867_19635 [Actinotalea fermentans ATCC 43279 = JCM 9966 = DSM 3133]GEN81379.1 hypothetical protein AFE02nite_31130 [Actinotalea fermentans]
MGAAKASRDQRRAAVEALRAEQARAERRRTRILLVTVVLVVLALAIPVALVLVRETREQERLAAAAEEPIEGEEQVEVDSAGHVTEDVPYEPPAPVAEGTRLPPVGGDHDPTPQNCGFYDQPVRDEHAVHSLEHGAVWLAYHPDAAEGDVDRLREIAQTTPYVLASPYEDLAAPVVATAWGVQLELDTTDDERLDAFLARYVQGEQTPEPGAACSGGVGAPLT